MVDSNTTPPAFPTQTFTDPSAAVDRLIEIYDRNTRFLRSKSDFKATHTQESIQGSLTGMSINLANTPQLLLNQHCSGDICVINYNYSLRIMHYL